MNGYLRKYCRKPLFKSALMILGCPDCLSGAHGTVCAGWPLLPRTTFLIDASCLFNLPAISVVDKPTECQANILAVSPTSSYWPWVFWVCLHPLPSMLRSWLGLWTESTDINCQPSAWKSMTIFFVYLAHFKLFVLVWKWWTLEKLNYSQKRNIIIFPEYGLKGFKMFERIVTKFLNFCLVFC